MVSRLRLLANGYEKVFLKILHGECQIKVEIISLTIAVLITLWGETGWVGGNVYFADQVESVGLWRQQQHYIRAVTCCKNKMSD